MYTATWIAQQGGTRNTTLAINLAVAGEAVGHRESSRPAVAVEIESALHREDTWAGR
ncbi:MAG: hypothetical protein OXC19_01015 [Bryobacterales bacterium]|nr:hypothetical protein [Bryobacterales bacterium]